MWPLLIVLAINAAHCEQIFSSTFAVTDHCIGLCQDGDLPPLELENYEQVVCQRGCRFFNIIHFKDELNVNVTRKECHLSCNESYSKENESKICCQGCDMMAQKRQTEMATFLIITEEDDISNNIVLAEPDLEILESDLLSDPSIKSQLEIGFNIDYKIPETRIRTMPIEFNDDAIIIKSNDYSGDWLDCASRNSGIPRWILLTAILSAVLIALWLSFSMERKVIEQPPDDEKLILENEVKNEPNLVVGGGANGELVAPPSYSIESEKV